jgi:uncharacterized Ntn-hydrolase superfamily protein
MATILATVRIPRIRPSTRPTTYSTTYSTTCSIVAADPERDGVGVAVRSRFPGVDALADTFLVTGYGGTHDLMVDLRVDHADDPIAEMRRRSQ